MMKNIKNKLAFSMLELIFVIIILGIISSLGAEIIANVYESYIIQRAQHRSSIKTQLAMNQITNRLRYTIPGTLFISPSFGDTPIPLSQASGGQYDVIQWVAYDGDSFEAITAADSGTTRRPGWSGFCDIDASSTTNISTPGSNFTLTNTIQGNLGGTGAFAVYFSDDSVPHYGTGADETITLGSATTRIVERYKLSWSSYALVKRDGDLYLYHKFAPTPGIVIPDTASEHLLLKNVTNFRYKIDGESIRFKVCVEEKISESETITSCKEKVLF